MTCRQIAHKQRKYHANPAFAEAERARQEAYYHKPGGGYYRKRLRELRGARQRVLGQLVEVRQLVDQP